jgi:hypothetical protein
MATVITSMRRGPSSDQALLLARIPGRSKPGHLSGPIPWLGIVQTEKGGISNNLHDIEKR